MDKPGVDIRTRTWYVQAQAAHHPVWTDVSVFLGVEGVSDVHGVTYATPVYSDDGRLFAVLDSDFDLGGLSRFLGTLKLGRKGFAFVIGRQSDGTQEVIAHPDLQLLYRRKAGAAGEATQLERLSPQEFPDQRVSSLAARLKLSWSEVTQVARSRIRFTADGETYLATVRSLESRSRPPWLICAVIPESEVLGAVAASIRDTLLLGALALAVAALLSRYVSTQVSHPLERLEREANAIERLQFEPRPIVRSIIREVEHLGVAIEEMKVGLRSFRKYIPTELFQTFLSSGQEAVFGGARRTVTIFFCDIVNFTAIAEDLEPEQLVELLREYHSTVCREIEATLGTVDKFIGDAVMAFWDIPAAGPNHATAGCTAALRCQSALDNLNERWKAVGKPQLRARIGLHTGEVVVGNIGSDARLSYTIIGDAVESLEPTRRIEQGLWHDDPG